MKAMWPRDESINRRAATDSSTKIPAYATRVPRTACSVASTTFATLERIFNEARSRRRDRRFVMEHRRGAMRGHSSGEHARSASGASAVSRSTLGGSHENGARSG